MADPIHDGGPAFPTNGPDHGVYGAGLTQRDYFAVHGEAPRVSDVVAAAGLTYLHGQVWGEPGTPRRDFDEWWSALGAAERMRLNAIVRYQMADAMLCAREIGNATLRVRGEQP